MADGPTRYVDEDTVITDRQDGDLVVRNGAHLVLNGLVSGTLSTDGPAKIALNGVALSLHVRAQGVVTVPGMVAGPVVVDEGGATSTFRASPLGR